MLARDTQANNLWNWLTEDPVRMKNFVTSSRELRKISLRN